MSIVRTIAAVSVLGTVLPVAIAAQDSSFTAETHRYLSRLEKLGFAGVVLATQEGRPLFAQGYGLADRERGTHWSPATVSTVGSITKQFTGAAMLALEEAGRLRVTDSITRYFRDVPPDKQAITLHQLLTHSSGITDLDAGDWDPIGREEFVRRAMAQPLAYPPGTGYAYSNAGYSLLGAIVEQLTGGSWEQYVRTRFFLPEGMYQTGYILPSWGEGQLAQGYRAGTRWGTVLERPMDRDGPWWVLRANGGVHAPAWDMLRWAEALRRGRVLSAASMEKLWHPWVDEGGGESFYGYGWVVMDYAGTRVVTHNGGNGIHFADLAIVPSARLVIFLQTNVIADIPVANQLLQQVGARFLSGTPYPAVPDVVATPQADLDRLAGSYRLTGGGGAFQVARVGDLLVAEAEGQQAFHLLHSSRVVDSVRAARLVGLTDRLLSGWQRGDLSDLQRDQPADVPLDRMAASLTSWVAARDSALGALQDYHVLGAALQETREMVVVRFRFERGSADRAYVWSMDERPRLLGVSGRGLRASLDLMPIGGDRFATWDGGLTATREVRFQGGRLTLAAPGGTIAAVR